MSEFITEREMRDELSCLRAENERLRALLQLWQPVIARYLDKTSDWFPGEHEPLRKSLADARAVLALWRRP